MVKFWIKDSGNFLSVRTGLTTEQVQFLQRLKVGDRLILWREKVSGETSPDLTLKQYKQQSEVV